MAQISIFVDDRIVHILHRLSVVQNKPIEIIASNIVESAAIAQLPGGQPHMHFADRGRLDLGGCSIGMVEDTNGNYRFTS